MSILENASPVAEQPAQVGDRAGSAFGEIHFDKKYYYRIINKTGNRISFDNRNLHFINSDAPNNIKVYSGEFLTSDPAIEDRVSDLVQLGEISCQSLEIEPETNYRISNRTARRIGIENISKEYEKKWSDLVIPPFGTRTVSSELLKWYKFIEWQRQDLIRIEREDLASRGPGSLSAFWNWLKLLPGLVLVSLIGFGIPLWVVYHFGGGDHLIASFFTGEMFAAGQESMALLGLGRLFQVGFICVAAIMPALFYYLFGRQQVEKLRQKFFHDVLVLDPHIYTLSEAESKYDTLLSSAYGSSSSSSPLAILLLMFSTAILVAGWTLTIAPYGSVADSATLIDFFMIKSSPLTLGFLGTYFFAINMIFRRYVRADLTPKTYAYITVRMLVTFVLVWSISILPEFSNAPLVENGLFPLAFIIGVFPEDGFRVMRDSVRKAFGGRFGGAEEKYPLTDLDGMNQYDQARLLEEGIENIENLAHHNLVELLAFTRIPTARLVDMFDQAILYLHMGIFDQPGDNGRQKQNGDEAANHQVDLKPNPTDPKTDSPAARETKADSGRALLNDLKLMGIRTATDLVRALKDENSLESMLGQRKLNRLKTIRVTFSDDEWLSYVMNWRKECSKDAVIRASFINDPYKFYDVGTSDTDRQGTSKDEKQKDKDQKAEIKAEPPADTTSAPQAAAA